MKKISITITPEIERSFPPLTEYIKRRHNIVHNADREIEVKKGHHKIKSINYDKVIKWQKILDQFVYNVNMQFKINQILFYTQKMKKIFQTTPNYLQSIL
ncbi:hypothetical protein ACQ9BO_07175 [Flavobacterium sp. P21]|uniref:hypothetical protein n=1 Tax=Flavobacterium sp. P21 TaxID=3423948 RepID=UPI003D6640AB